jgi:uncharacterized membrane protein
VIVVTHCFDKTLMETVTRDNVNPIEKVERTQLRARQRRRQQARAATFGHVVADKVVDCGSASCSEHGLCV